MPMTGSVVKREIVSEEFEWTIENFTLTEETYMSPDCKFQNVAWTFAVFPNLVNEYIDLGLWKKSIDSPMNVEICVALKTSDGLKSFERSSTEIFDEGKHCCVYRWISRSDVESRHTEFLSSGCLTLMITLKRIDFVESARKRHFFRSKYKNSSDPISPETLTSSDSSKNENASQEFEWNIENFSLHGEYYWSPEFMFQSETWDFNVEPNISDGCIDLGVRRNSSSSPLLVEISFALKTSDGQRNFERVWTEVFDEWKLDCDYEWINTSEFETRKTEFLLSGCLTVTITLKVVDLVEPANAIGTDVCPCCKESLHDDKIAVHRKCLDESKCPKCSQAVSSQNTFSHKCQVATIKDSTSTHDSSAVGNHSKILQDLKQLLLNQENSDVVLRVKGEEFKGHRAILAARSPVFASTFRNEMKEKKTGIVDIVDCEPSVFPNFLCYLYSDDTDSLSGENVFDLFKIADKYECLDLRAKCLDFMKQNLSVETFCEALTVALKYGEAELLRTATDFFIKNAEKILVTVSWQTFAAENPTQSNELVIKLVTSYKSSNHVP